MDILKIHYCGRVTSGKVTRKLTGSSSSQVVAFTPRRAGWLLALGVDGLLKLKRGLALANVPILQKRSECRSRATRGSRGISGAGRTLVRDAATYLEETYGRERLSFLTLTLPPECLQESLYLQWQDLTRKLRQRLLYALQASGLPPYIVGVVEIQEGRQKSVGPLPALHWHFVFVGKHANCRWALSKEWFRAAWQDLLEKAVGHPVNGRRASRVERIYVSASGYLGKYMSKGVAALSTINMDYCPKSWYMCTQPLKDKVKTLTRYITGTMAASLKEILEKNKEWLRYRRDINITLINGITIGIGWVGEMVNRQAYHEFVKICDEGNRAAMRPLPW